MGNKLVNKANMIATKSKHAKKHILELIVVRYNIFPNLATTKWASLTTDHSKKIIVFASIFLLRSSTWSLVHRNDDECLALFNWNFTVCWMYAQRFSWVLFYKQYSSDMSIAYEHENRSISIHNLKDSFLRRMAWVN